jgi:hypothetical protein
LGALPNFPYCDNGIKKLSTGEKSALAPKSIIILLLSISAYDDNAPPTLNIAILLISFLL